MFLSRFRINKRCGLVRARQEFVCCTVLSALCLFLATPIVKAQSLDAELDIANKFIGRPLILRGMFLDDNLRFDASGKVTGAPRTGSFTLCEVDLEKVKRHGGEIEFRGLRSGLRYSQDSKAFYPMPLKDYPIKITVADSGDPGAFEATLNAIFSQHLSPAMKASMPDYWQHFFDPKMPWQDGGIGLSNPKRIGKATGVLAPKLLSGPDPKYNDYARKRRIEGVSVLQLVIDAKGNPQQVSIKQPLGFGLDEEAVKSVLQYRFAPAMLEGASVPVEISIEVNFHIY
ncbi:MAG: energy transducer TonB [Acidobacteriaceae bacterium]